MAYLDKDSIYRQYHEKVLRYVRSKGVSPFEAEDVCANVFLKVFSKFDSFDQSKSSVSTWIYTISQNTVIDLFRSGYSRYHGEFTEDFQEEDIEYVDSSFDDILNDETLTELAQALKKLDQRSRDLIILVYYKNLTLKAAAEKIGSSYSNSKILIKKALEQLKSYLSDSMIGDRL